MRGRQGGDPHRAVTPVHRPKFGEATRKIVGSGTRGLGFSGERRFGSKAVGRFGVVPRQILRFISSTFSKYRLSVLLLLRTVRYIRAPFYTSTEALLYLELL